MRLEFEQLARTATRCRECFADGRLTAPYIDVAQPRWVGPSHWDSQARVAVLMINPGRSPKGSKSAAEYLPRLRAFRDGEAALDELLAMQRTSIESRWLRFRKFYITGLGLKLDELAFANVGWCATAENRYPRWMLERCYAKHTSYLFQLLQPHVVFASGRPVHPFARQIRGLLPQAKVIETLHYAHREGRAAQDAELTRLRQELASLFDGPSRPTKG